MMYTKIEFFTKFYSMAKRDLEMYHSSNSIAEELEYRWEQTLEWYEKTYPQRKAEVMAWDYRNFGGVDYV